MGQTASAGQWFKYKATSHAMQYVITRERVGWEAGIAQLRETEVP